MKKRLFVLGFVENQEDNNELICNINDYFIQIFIDDVNIRDLQIDYGKKIIIHNNVVCSLKKDENLV